MSLFKQKSTEFNFSKKSPPSSFKVKNKRKIMFSSVKKQEEFNFKKQNIKPKKLLRTTILENITNFAGIFMFSQFLFLFGHIIFDDTEELRKKENYNFGIALNSLNVAIDKKDEQEILTNFIKLKKINSISADLMASSIYMRLSSKNDDGNFSSTALNKIKEIEKTYKYSGLEKQENLIKNKSCFILDGICNLDRYLMNKQYQLYATRTKNQIDQMIHNSEHIKEYKNKSI